MEAQENDNLIFFCGAGVSCPAGLPLFEGLVDEVYQELVATPSKQEQNAINRCLYDTALELLERRSYSENPVLCSNRTKLNLVAKRIALFLIFSGRPVSH